MSFVLVFWSALFLDVLLGDPERLLHPVQVIGNLIQRAEPVFRRLCSQEELAGAGMAAVVTLAAVAATALSHGLVASWSAAAGTGLAAWILYQTLALRSLADHARAVHRALVQADDLSAARKRVAMLVGRDTATLDRAGIVRACVESIAENMSDGVVAPAMYAFAAAALALLLGLESWTQTAAVAAAMGYKAVNTLDSMVGYRNDRYLSFGRPAARLDDLVNMPPARISGLALVLATLLTGRDFRRSLQTMLRDRHRHASPNAGYPEAAMAGALGITLGGPASYFGTRVAKPVIGTPVRPPRPGHIIEALRLLYVASFLTFLFFSLLLILLAACI